MSLVRISWPTLPSPPSLHDDEVHVWTAGLDHERDRFLSLSELLVDEDLERAAGYRIPVVREHFIAARAFLRSVLGGYLHVDPRKVTFHYGPQGKPYLLHPPRQLFFNLSHSHGLALVAVSRNVEVGVDVEKVRNFNDLGFAERYFTTREVSTLLAVPEHQRTEVFFHAWTRKEAFLKATGEGIAIGLDRVEVALAPWEPVRLVLLDGCPHQAAEWSLSHLSPATEYVGALALKHRRPQVRCWHWPAEALVATELQSA
jgi:4'-phosphopantetheinyl transferase